MQSRPRSSHSLNVALPTAILTAFLMLAVPAQAKEEPLWELGVGIGALTMPDYTGSDENLNYVFPIPYVVYNGEILKVDRQGVRGDLFQSDRVKFDISLNAGAPVESGENGARVGMPDLDPTFELGPSLQFLLWRSEDRRHVWTLRFPVRAVVATDFEESHSAGWRFQPNVNYDAEDVGPGGGWEWGIAVGPVWGSERYHDYYYEVAPQYATASRPAYDADGGYGGIRIGWALRKRFKKVWFGLFARYNYIGGAVFEDSPLVKRSHALVVGGGISYIFAQSDERVQVQDCFC